MEILYALEKIRTPFLDSVMSLLTYLGSEALFLVLALIIFWCIDKKEGYYIMAVGFFGIVANQFLKLWFRIPRPWVLDPNFTIVEAAREGAGGYSFPSGHTQSVVGTFGCLARYNSKYRWFCVLCVLLPCLVGFSRMYLGVHTLLDVGFSFLFAWALVLLMYPIITKIYDQPKKMYLMFGIMIAFCLSFVLFTQLYSFPADVMAEELQDSMKNGFSLSGGMIALIFVYLWDHKKLNFSTEAVWWAQILKVAIGGGIALGIKEGLKPLLLGLFNGHPLAHLLRYTVVVLFIGLLWPMTFRWFGRLGKKKDAPAQAQ